MNIPKTADDLKNEIYISSDKFEDIGDLRIRQLNKILPNVSDQIIIEGIISLFEANERSSKSYRDQEFAGKVLEVMKPNSSSEIKDLLTRSLKNWDKSIEQLPIWFRENYGYDCVLAAFSDLENSGISDLEMDKIKTMKFWIGKK